MHLEKPDVDSKKEPFRYLCNELYFTIHPLLLLNDRAAAFFYGFCGGYAVASTGGSLADLVVEDHTLRTITQFSTIGTAALGVSSYAIPPLRKKLQPWREEHPIYSTGILGIMTGTVARGIQHLL